MSQPYLTAGPLAFLPDEYESFQVIKNPDYMSIPQIVTFSEMHNDSFMDDYKYLFYKLKEEKKASAW